MKKLVILTLALSLLGNASFSAETDRYVLKVTQNADKTVTFEKCESQNKDRCVTLGAKQKYTREEIASANKKIKLIAAGKVASLAAVTAVVTFFTFGYTVRCAIDWCRGTIQQTADILVSNAIGWIPLIGIPVYFTPAYISKINKYNPARQWRKANALTYAALSDGSIDSKNMKDFIELVEEALNSIK